VSASYEESVRLRLRQALGGGALLGFERFADVIADIATPPGQVLGRLSPEEFGAVGDGVADDRPAWALAAEAAALMGLPARMMPGRTYRLASQLLLPAGCVIEGCATSRFTASGADFTATTNLFTATGTVIYAESVANVRLVNRVRLELTGMVAGRQVNGIAIRGCTDAEVCAEVWGLNAGACIVIDTCVRPRVYGCILRDCLMDRPTNGQLTGIRVDDNRISGVGTTGFRIERCEIRDLAVTPAFLTANGFQTDGINIMKTSQGMIAHCDIRRVGEAYDIWGDGVQIVGGYNEEVYIGVKIIHGARRCTVRGMWTHRAAMAGYVFAGSNTAGNVMEHCLIESCVASRVGYLAPSHPPGWSTRAGFMFDDVSSTWGVFDSGFKNCVVMDSPDASHSFAALGSGSNLTGTFFEDCTARDGPASLVSINTVNCRWRSGLASDGTQTTGSGSRVLTTRHGGLVEHRYDDNQTVIVRQEMNAGINAADRGLRYLYQLGNNGSGVTVTSAARMDVLSTDTWATTTNRSARIEFWAAQANTEVEVAELHPGQGVALLIGTAPGVGLVLRRLEVGAVDSAGAGYRTVRVAN
jgi:hypothetical protein